MASRAPFFPPEVSTSLVPDYCSIPSLQYAKNLIINPPPKYPDGRPLIKHYEHHVGSWAATMLKKAFSDDKWIITPEKLDEFTETKPDLVVENVEILADHKLDEKTWKVAKYHLIVELKSSDGDRFEKALDQAIKDKVESLEDIIEVFIIVMRGTKIGFFEYHNDRSMLEDNGVANFRGCVSLTQDYYIGDAMSIILHEKPDDLKLLFHDTKNLRGLSNRYDQEIRDDAAKYKVPCVFDLLLHEKEINILIHHMVNNDPRSSSEESSEEESIEEEFGVVMDM